jgi:uncharacterized membrane protein
MPLSNPRSAFYGALFLIPVGITIYHWLQYRSLLQNEFGVGKMVVCVLALAAAVYFVWHSCRAQTDRHSEDTDKLAAGIGSLILAVALTLNGLGYQFHTLKVMVVALLYVTAAFLLWDAFKRRSTIVTSHLS